MRITGGSYKGRKLKAPEGLTTRPTSDRVREALFNILAHHDWGPDIDNPIENAIVLDAFAGTGAFGLEALSRGAARALFFEKDKKALQALHANIKSLDLQGRTRIMSCDVTLLNPPAQHPACSLVYLDPPYGKDLIRPALDALSARGLIMESALIILETHKSEQLELPLPRRLIVSRTYGDTTLGFFL